MPRGNAERQRFGGSGSKRDASDARATGRVRVHRLLTKRSGTHDIIENIRSLARDYSENGESIWSRSCQQDPAISCWYYRTAAEYVELALNRTGAYKELVKHINYLWPGTFAPEKTRYRKYRDVSLEGCRLLGSGRKGEVYRYDDELILKVYNHNNTYRDVEQEIAQSRRAFLLGIPTAIFFGIVSVGERCGLSTAVGSRAS